MGRRERPPELQIRSAFEATRTAAQCLAEAYERLVPIPRRLPRLPITRGSTYRRGRRRSTPGRGALSMGRIVTALYARVSSDGQARGNTVASQLAELRARAAADEVVVGPGAQLRGRGLQRRDPGTAGARAAARCGGAG